MKPMPRESSALFTHLSIALTLATLCAPNARAIGIYFADLFVPSVDYGSIRYIATSGEDLETLNITGGGLRALDVDGPNGKIYWCDANNFVIRRSDLNGCNQEDLVTKGVLFPSAIALHNSAGKMYWGDQLNNFIYRANKDGTNVEPVLPTAFHRGIAIDAINNKIYWSTSNTTLKGDIKRANLDGSNIETVVSSLDPEFKPSAIALDVVGGKVYWTDYVVDIVRRANLNGTMMEDLYVVGANHNPRGIVVDRLAGKVYWGQDIDFDGTGGMLMRMNLDGSSVETVASGLGLVNYLALGPNLPVSAPCDGDIAPGNCNGAVDVDDLLMVINNWGECFYPGLCQSDITGNGFTDVDDLLAVINTWGPCK
jgi:hypothetical protein